MFDDCHVHISYTSFAVNCHGNESYMSVSFVVTLWFELFLLQCSKPR